MGWWQKQQGHQAEKSVAQWLTQQGIQVIAQNFHCKGGELDIVALDTAQTLLFIEVKHSQNLRHGNPIERITPQKQQRLIRCAQYFLLKHPDYHNHPMRFDAITQVGTETPQWLKNAFQAF